VSLAQFVQNLARHIVVFAMEVAAFVTVQQCAAGELRT